MNMIRYVTLGALALFPVFLAANAEAQSREYKLAQLVNERRQLMFDLERAYWVLLDVRNGKSSDFDDAATAAKKMGNIIVQFSSLMRPDTARGEAPGSRAKPEVWSESEEFGVAVAAFQEHAIQFAQVATRQNLEEYMAEFEAFTSACTTCHGFRPSSGGRFRYAMNE
jgi:cytochrome c556